MQERVVIIIDGNNFYHRLKELKFGKPLLGFDYERLVHYLLTKRTLVLKKYYIGAIREEVGNSKSRELMIGQQKLLGKLKKHGWKIGFGHMLKTDDYHEKGVDVLIAVDLLVGAYEDKYDIAILVSSDTDLIPAIQKARSMKKRIEYIGFSHKPSYGLIANSDVRRLLIKEELLGYLESKE